MQNEPKLKIFSDFDGTITLYDTWIEMGEFFIKKKDKWEEVIRDYEEQKIGARECFLKECALIENFDLKEFNRIIDSQRLDPMFIKFTEFLSVRNIPLTILSEGMDYYIKRILDNYKLSIPFYANSLVISEDEKNIGLEFPNSDSDCTKCGTSKRNILMNNTADDEISVFIGDGFSDSCVVNYADIVFAKKSLASYCWKNNITYHEYQTFGDIIKKLEKFLTLKKLKHRDSAKRKRREVFLRG
ncbi:MAG TPA: HAD-IB family phosphatase [Ignavibacteria bacterium]|nr:HAD-IB family phosphatase [Ignavibacteria bacterium]